MNTAQWNVKGSITRYTPGSSAKKKEEEGYISTYKLTLLRWVENVKIFSKDIMRVRLLNFKDASRFLSWK